MAERGIGFFGVLQIAFIIMKLAHVVDWSWAFVFIPAYISLAIFVLILAVFLYLIS